MSSSLEDEFDLPTTASLPSVPLASLTISNSSAATIQISQETSLRSSSSSSSSSSSPRCLIVGRQAATADLRVQHGSISRKHAILYYDNDNDNSILMLKELGGKHGTHVNGARIQGSVALKHGDQIMFGNVQESIFTVALKEEAENKPDTTRTVQANHSSNTTAESSRTQEVAANDDAADLGDESSKQQQEEDIAATTRQDREAQIANMVASLDATPTYEKFTAITEPPEAQSSTKSTTASRAAKKLGLPIAQEFHVEAPTLGGANAATNKQSLNALVVDKSGSRFAVGHGPYLKLYDFSGMDRQRTAPFKTILVEEGYTVEHVCYSNTGDRALVGTASPQPTILDRDGNEVVQFVRGDQYVMDMARTTGHVNAVTGVDWHPLDRDIVLTSSMDGSARLWNLNGKTIFHKLVCDKVYRAKSSKGQRTAVTAVAYHPGGREFALGTSCGSLQIWNTTKVGPRPDRLVYDVHGSGKPITAIVYNAGGTQIATRSSEDDAVHVWDARRLSKSARPVSSFLNVQNVHERADCDFSPNGKCVVVGCSEYEKDDKGQRIEVGSVKFFEIRDGNVTKPIDEVPTQAGLGVVKVQWHGKLNQILVGCSDASVLILFDETMSKNGAMISMAKAGRTIDGLSQLLKSRAVNHVVTGEIITPFSAHTNKKRKDRDGDVLNQGANSSKMRQPELPARGIKAGGQSSASATFNQFISKSITKKKAIAGEDPRESLFQYHDANAVPKETRILADKTAEEEEDERLANNEK